MATVGRHNAAVRPRRWTRQEYHRMAEAGLFAGQRVELLEGKVVVLSPQNAPHWSATERVRAVLAATFGTGHLVRMQGPIDLGQHTEPEPDVAVVVGSVEDYTQAHPVGALLIVEVSDSTLSFDRRRKGSLYARAGVADYWIVNLVHRQAEVYRDPMPDAKRPYGHRYASRHDLRPGAPVSPLALPGVSLPVTDLLGP